MRKPSRRSRRSAARAADPGSLGLSIRVSNAAAATRGDPPRTVSSQSRSPDPADTSGRSACLAASWRVPGRLIPKACVGPPTTTRSTSSSIAAGATPTSTAVTRMRVARPSATASAITLVLPNIDSKTMSARMSLPPPDRNDPGRPALSRPPSKATERRAPAGRSGAAPCGRRCRAAARSGRCGPSRPHHDQAGVVLLGRVHDDLGDMPSDGPPEDQAGAHAASLQLLDVPLGRVDAVAVAVQLDGAAPCDHDLGDVHDHDLVAGRGRELGGKGSRSLRLGRAVDGQNNGPQHGGSPPVVLITSLLPTAPVFEGRTSRRPPADRPSSGEQVPHAGLGPTAGRWRRRRSPRHPAQGPARQGPGGTAQPALVREGLRVYARRFPAVARRLGVAGKRATRTGPPRRA